MGDDGTRLTIPSIQSELIGASGSYSRAAKVPSELRAVSRLANCPTVGAQGAFVVTQLETKNVDVLRAAVIEPRVEVLRVTEVVDAAVTTPVMSSTKSNWPAPRLELDEVGASVEAVKTFAAVRSTFETTWACVLMVMALAKLNWI